MRTTTLAMATTIALLSSTTAQQLSGYDPFAGMITEGQPWSAMLPFPGGPTNTYPAVPMPPPGPALVPMAGDASWDGLNGLHWLCNGAMLASQPTPLFPPLAPPTPPFPIAPAVLAGLGGFVSGIAYDSAAGILWLCGPFGAVIGVAPVPGTPVLAPGFALAFPAPPIAGLEWDAISGAFYAVDIGGVVYPFVVGGAPAGPPIVSAFPFAGMIGDVAIDKSGQLNAIGVRAIYVVDGPMVVDVTLPLPLVTPWPIGPPMNVGLAYLGAPASNPPGGGCACPTFAPGPTHYTTSVMSSQNLAFRIGVGGLPPGQPVLFGFDFFFNAGWPMINGIGCPLGFVLGSPSMVTFLGFANAAGNATFPLALAVPPGWGAVYNQNFTLCPADPAGFVATPMQSLWASGY